MIGRRAFLREVGGLAGSAGALLRAGAAGSLLAACGGDESTVAAPSDNGTIEGVVVSLAGVVQPSLGQVFLMYRSGLQSGRSTPVDSVGEFVFPDVAPGEWQLRFQAPGRAHVPEELPHPVRVTVPPKLTVNVTITVELTDPEDGMVEIYAGDDFFQEQPSGTENGETVVKVGTPVCWYNVGNSVHTVTGGPWGDSGDLARTASYIWVAATPGVYPYRCRYHSPQMQATLRVTE